MKLARCRPNRAKKCPAHRRIIDALIADMYLGGEPYTSIVNAAGLKTNGGMAYRLRMAGVEPTRYADKMSRCKE